MEQRSFFGLSEHLERISKIGDPLEVLEAAVDFEYFRVWLLEGLGYGDGARGGRPPFDPVSMFTALILQAQHNLSDAKMEFMIRDRLSWMRFLGFDLGGPTPDENTIRLFRNKLTETGTLKRVMKAFDWQLQKKGCQFAFNRRPVFASKVIPSCDADESGRPGGDGRGFAAGAAAVPEGGDVVRLRRGF